MFRLLFLLAVDVVADRDRISVNKVNEFREGVTVGHLVYLMFRVS